MAEAGAGRFHGAAHAQHRPPHGGGLVPIALGSVDDLRTLSSQSEEQSRMGSYTPLLHSRRAEALGLTAVLLLHSLSALPALLVIRVAVEAAVAAGGAFPFFMGETVNAMALEEEELEGGGALNHINLNLASGLGTTLLACAAVAVALTWLPGVVCALLVVEAVPGALRTGREPGQDPGLALPVLALEPHGGQPAHLGTSCPSPSRRSSPGTFASRAPRSGGTCGWCPRQPRRVRPPASPTTTSGGDYSVFCTGSDGVSRPVTWARQSGATDRAVACAHDLGERCGWGT